MLNAPATRAAATPPAELVEADDLLARRTTERFLTLLVEGQVDRALELYVSETAQSAAGRLLSALEAPGPRIVGASLLKIERVTDTRYAGEALLEWAGEPGSNPAFRQMNLTLAKSRGLWLIDTIVLVKPEASTPSP